jgi:hypothetical protein
MAEAFVPLSFAPGEAYQFDRSHEIVLINGVTVTVRVGHVRLCHSRMLFVRAYPRETQEMVFDAHNRAFAFFKGTCTRGVEAHVIDASSVAVSREHRRAKTDRLDTELLKRGFLGCEKAPNQDPLPKNHRCLIILSEFVQDGAPIGADRDPQNCNFPEQCQCLCSNVSGVPIGCRNSGAWGEPLAG